MMTCHFFSFSTIIGQVVEKDEYCGGQRVRFFSIGTLNFVANITQKNKQKIPSPKNLG